MQYWEMSSGGPTDPALRAIALPGDSYSRPEVHVQLLTDNGALIPLHCTGLVKVNDDRDRQRMTRPRQKWQRSRKTQGPAAVALK